MKRISWVSVIAVFLALAAFAFGMISRQVRDVPDKDSAVDARPIDTVTSHAGRPTDSPSTVAYREASARMHEAMGIDYTGEADIDFLRGMIAHHEGALAMAKIAVEHGEAQDVRNLAEEIIAAQETEIVRMKVMLARHEGAPAPVGGR
ncbi:DUF305 domain-containing protein [Brevundimonas sp.]|jgi:uncharacterized protein (DUF305 family)|uniref:CopM family metallochaperone n=1 Tax=Brevundimonas sp. TaxID=1871086 RepID=UPI0037BF6623